MEQGFIRLLKANEIECRTATVNEKGLSLLLYKDARVDQRILDETFGVFGWKRSHQCIDGNLYCTVEIYDAAHDTWVSKQDVGTMGYAEKEKSQASDSFKRACFNWGIGRELYSAPFIWIPAGKVKIQSRGDKFYCNERFSVSAIGYSSDREINMLVIINDKGKPVYEMKAGSSANDSDAVAKKEQAERKLSANQMDAFRAELDRTGVTLRAVQERFSISEPEGMSRELYSKVMTALKRTKSVQAA